MAGPAELEDPPTPSSGDVYSKPRPRPPKTPAHSARVRMQNRRREYLERHPDYFQSLEHELADPLLYDALVRRFQTADEREKEGRTKGYARVLEVDLLRGEARPSHPADDPRGLHGALTFPRTNYDTDPRERVSPLNQNAEDEAGRPQTRQEGRRRWDDFLRQRFILGKDDDFDYVPVDHNDDLDVWERRDDEDAWFNAEEPSWAEGPSDAAEGCEDRRRQGETGVQDF